MKKLIFPVFLVCNFLLVAITGCTANPAQLLPFLASPTPTPRPEGAFISISVSPYYDSQGPQINVGKYSEELKTEDLQALTTLAQKMAQQKEALTPEQMYVLAIRLYNLGDRDNSVYWYYEAQFRARLFQQTIEPAQMVTTNDQTFKLSTAYDSFQQLAGAYINGYAGCNLDNWVKYTKMVKEDNPKPPALDQIFPDVLFVKRDQWQSINDQVAQGLDKLSNYIADNGATIKLQREQQKMDEKYCK